MQKNKTCLLALSILISTASFSQIKINLKKGDKYRVETALETNSVAQVMGQEMESNAEIKITTVYEVNVLKPAETDLLSTITKMKVNVSALGQETQFDSDKKDNTGPGADELSAVINKAKNMTIDLKGNILKQDKESSEAMAGMLGTGDNGAGENNNAEFVVPALIGRELKEGDSFPYSDSVKTEKTTTLNSGTYTVKKIDDGMITLSYDGTLTFSGVLEQMGQEMKTVSTSKVSSEIKLDLKTGIVKENSSSTDGNMTIEIAGMSIPVTLKTKKLTKVSSKD